MSNPFQHTTEVYYQVPKRLMLDGTVRPSSMALYLTVLRQAQEKTSTVVLFNTSTLLDVLNITRGNLRLAREQLLNFNLVASTEVRRGLWLFELLSLHCKRLDNSVIDLDKLSTDEVKSYFLPYLKDYDFIFTTDGNLIARCPFCHNMKAREKPFSLKLSDDDDGNGKGVWHCFACQSGGRMVEFERQRTKARNIADAHKQVLNFFMRQREGDPNTPMQTTLPVPSGVGHDYVGMVNDDDEPQAI